MAAAGPGLDLQGRVLNMEVRSEHSRSRLPHEVCPCCSSVEHQMRREYTLLRSEGLDTHILNLCDARYFFQCSAQGSHVDPLRHALHQDVARFAKQRPSPW